MTRRANTLVCVLAGCCIVAPGCSIRRQPAMKASTLLFEQGSYAIRMLVDPAGFIHLSDHPPLLGRLQVFPIIQAEHSTPESVLVMLNQGRLYLAADGFGSLWEVAPGTDPSAARYRAFPIPSGAATGVRLSRYGPPGRACVRLDAEATGPWFLAREGGLHDLCP